MSRNRCTSQCDCGYQIEPRNIITRPLYFDEYLRAIGVKEGDGFPYYYEYEDLIVAQAQCPECGLLWCVWLGSRRANHSFGCGMDTSYWYSFNDEPCDKDKLFPRI